MNTMENSCPEVIILAGWLEGTLSPQDRSRMGPILPPATTVAGRSPRSTLDAAPAQERWTDPAVKDGCGPRRRRLLPMAAAAAAVLPSPSASPVPRSAAAVL
jgi:hypothetical protein